MENEGYKKGEMILVVGDGIGSAYNQLLKVMEKTKNLQVAFLDLECAGIAGSIAGSNLKTAMEKLDFPIVCLDEMDYNALELHVLDSLSEPELLPIPDFNYEEGEISKKAWKKLQKNLKKINSDLEPKSQKEIWANKWDKKIKRKL